jgi:hypothetical protein
MLSKYGIWLGLALGVQLALFGVQLLLQRYFRSLEGVASRNFYWVLETVQIALIVSMAAYLVLIVYARRSAVRSQLAKEGLLPAHQLSRLPSR